MKNINVDGYLSEINQQLSSSYRLDKQVTSGGLTQVYVLFEKGRAKSVLKVGANQVQLKGERQDLELLKSQGYLLIPEVLIEADQYTLFEYISESSETIDWSKFGESLAKLHFTTTKNSYGNSYDNYLGDTLQKNDWEENWADFFWNNRIIYLLDRIQQKHSSLNLESFYGAKNKIYDLLSACPETPSFIHGDLWSGNFINSHQGVYLIDPAGYFAQREMEFGMISLFGGFDEEFFSSYQRTYPFQVGYEERIRLYQMYHLLNHYLLFGGGYLEQAKACLSR